MPKKLPALNGLRSEQAALVDYIHYNPVKHNLVPRVFDWPYSTFHRYTIKGLYSIDWGGENISLT